MDGLGDAIAVQETLEGATAAAAAGSTGAGAQGGGGGSGEPAVQHGGENVLRGGMGAGRPPPVPHAQPAAAGLPPRQPNSRSRLLERGQFEGSSSQASIASMASAGSDAALLAHHSSLGSLPSLPSSELSFRHGLAAAAASSKRGASGSLPRIDSEASEHSAPLLPRAPTSSAGGEAAGAAAASPPQEPSLREIHTPRSSGGAAGGSPPAAAAAAAAPDPYVAAMAAAVNPLFLPSSLGGSGAAGPAAGGGPIPYRTVSSESDALRAAVVELMPGRQVPPSRSPGWATPRDEPSAAERNTVVQHSMAGDLHLPAAVAAAAGNAALAALAQQAQQPPGGHGGFLPPGGSPLKSGGGGGGGAGTPRGISPRPSDAARQVQEKLQGGGAPSTTEGNSPRKGDSEYDFELEERSKPWFRRKRFWRVAIPLAIMLFFICLGTGFVVLGSKQDISIKGSEFQIWRLCFFFAGIPVIWWSGDWLMRLVVYFVERTMFTWRNALYFVYAVKRPATNVIRAAATLGWWAGMMTIGNADMASGLSTAYNVILKLWACVTLFMTANLLKTLLAKLLSSKFNKHSHLQKMHDSLRKEHMLHTLLQPRPKPAPALGALPAGEGDGGCFFPQEGDGACTPRRSASEQTLGAEAAGGSPGKPSHSSSLPGRGRGAPKETSSSFKNMLLFLRRGKTLSTIREESPALEDPNAAGLGPAASPGAGAPPLAHCPPSPHGTAVHVVIDGHSTPMGQRSPAGKMAGSPGPGRRGGGLEHAHSGDSGLSRQTSLASPMSRRSKPLSRQASVAGSRGLHRSGGLKQGSQASKAEETRAEAMASANIQASESMSSRTSDDVLAEKLVKMEKYIRKHALQVTFKDELTRTERRERVTSEMEAKKLAFYLFWNVKDDFASREVTLDDLRDFLPEKDAQRAFEMLDDDGDGAITLQDCCSSVVKIFKDRENLAASLKDTKTVVGKLETLLGGILHTIFGFIYLAIFNVDVMQFYLAFSSLVLAFSFIFNSSLRQMYENVVFLFVIHPYDIGDTLVIDNESYRVDEINLQFTTLINGSNARVWYPNQKMLNAPFINLTASGNKGESFKVLVDLDTPGSVLDEVRAAAEAHLKEWPLEFNGTLGVSFNTSANPLKMTLSVYYEFSHNGTDGGRCSRARNKLFILLAQTLSRLGVQYTWPEVRQRYVAGPGDGSRGQAQVEAALASAATGADPAADDLKQKLL